MPPALAFNTAASFTTNTNWQAYGGETTMSYLTQMAGLAYHNFVSAATGIALAIAFIRGIAQREKDTLGNFWVDLVRACLWVLLPFCIVGALFLVSQGVDPEPAALRRRSTTRRRARTADDRAGAGRLAGDHQEVRHQRRRLLQRQQRASVRESDAAHQLLRDVLHLRDPRRADLHARRHDRIAPPRLGGLGRDGVPVPRRRHDGLLGGGARQSAADRRRRGSDGQRARRQAATWRARKSRFGIANSALFATVTTDASCGAINGWHDSFTPLGGMVPLVNIMLGEVIFGGVGAGHVRHADLRRPLGLHRRPDGRPHAGVSRQEDRSLRRQDGDAGRADLPAHHSGASPAISTVSPSFGTVEHRQPGPARPVARFSTPSRRRPATTARRSAA